MVPVLVKQDFTGCHTSSTGTGEGHVGFRLLAAPMLDSALLPGCSLLVFVLSPQPEIPTPHSRILLRSWLLLWCSCPPGQRYSSKGQLFGCFFSPFPYHMIVETFTTTNTASGCFAHSCSCGSQHACVYSSHNCGSPKPSGLGFVCLIGVLGKQGSESVMVREEGRSSVCPVSSKLVTPQASRGPGGSMKAAPITHEGRCQEAGRSAL